MAAALGSGFLSHSGLRPGPSATRIIVCCSFPITLPPRPAPPSSTGASTRDVYRFTVDVVRGLHQRLPDSGVRVDGVADILDGESVPDGHRYLVYQVGDMRTHHVGAQHFVRGLVGDDLDVTLSFSDGQCLARGAQPEGSRDRFEPHVPRLILGQAYAGDLRQRVDA